jgi:peptidyl-prolyl cis-trans isomerase SurA
VILLSDVRNAYQDYLTRLGAKAQQLSPADHQALRQDVLQTLIDEKIVLQFAKKQNAMATDEEIDEQIKNIAAEENMTIDQIYADAGEAGLSKKAYREELGKQITRMRIYQGAVQGKVRVSDDDVKKLYEQRYGHAKPGEQIRVLHILIPVPPDAPAEKRAEARKVTEGLRAQAVQSGDFASLARRYSRAPTAPQGGLTTFREADAPADIKAAIAGLKPGEVSQVIETAHGENLFQYLDRFDPASVTFEQVSDKLRAELVEQQTKPAFEKWIAEVRKGRYIEVVAPELR